MQRKYFSKLIGRDDGANFRQRIDDGTIEDDWRRQVIRPLRADGIDRGDVPQNAVMLAAAPIDAGISGIFGH